jgi:tetratricopeptide (TPR) repeat protein
MATLRMTIRAAVTAILLFATVPAVGLEEWVWEMLRTCYQGRPTRNELCKRLEGAIATHRGTHVEDDLLLALADAHVGAGRAQEAIPILQRLIQDKKATKIDMVSFWVGWRTGEMMEVKKLYERSPDFTSDHALLRLAHLHRRLGNLEESWETFEKLRAKYPQGDRVQGDLRLMEDFRKTHPQLPKRLIAFRLKALPANAMGGTERRYVVGSDPQAARLCEEFLRRRRPHLTGLQEQAALWQQMGRSSEECVAILKDVVSIYDPLLTEEELTEYCRQGLTEIESLKEKAQPETLSDLNQAAKVFTRALETLTEEEKGRFGKVADETGAED